MKKDNLKPLIAAMAKIPKKSSRNKNKASLDELISLNDTNGSDGQTNDPKKDNAVFLSKPLTDGAVTPHFSSDLLQMTSVAADLAPSDAVHPAVEAFSGPATLDAKFEKQMHDGDQDRSEVPVPNFEPATLSNAATPWVPISSVVLAPAAPVVIMTSRTAGFLALSLSYTLAMLHRTSFTEVSQALAGDNSLSSSDLAWVGPIFFWIYLIFQIPASILVDSAGSRRVAAWGCLAMALGAAIFAGTNNVYTLVAARGLCAMGAVSVFMAMIAYCSRSVGEHSSVAFGRALLIGNMGGVMAGYPLESSITAIGWRSVWYIVAIFGVLCAYGIWKYLHSAGDARDKSAILASMRNSIPGFKDSLRRSDVYLAAGALAGLAGTFHAFSGLGAHYFSVHMGVSSGIQAIMISVMVSGLALGALLWGRVGVTHKGRRMSLIIAPVLSLVLWSLLSIAPPSDPWILGLTLFISGVLSASFAIIYPVLDDLNGSRVSTTLKGTANSGIALGAVVTQGSLFPGTTNVPSIALAALGVFCCWTLAARLKRLKQSDSGIDLIEPFEDLAAEPSASKA